MALTSISKSQTHSESHSSNRKSPSKKQVGIGAGALLAFGTLYAIYQSLFYVTTDNAEIEGRTVLLSPKVAGYVSKVNAEENQKVKAGDILVEIDNRDYKNANLQVENEKASLEARTADAQRNAKRMTELFNEGAVTRQQYETTIASAQELQKKLEALKSQVSQSQLNLDFTQIRAPSDGFIAKRSVEVGMFAGVGAPLMGFVSSQERWVTANFKETDLHSIQVGQKVDVEVDALPGRHFPGEVESLSPSTGAAFTLLPPDNAVGNFTKVVQRVPLRVKLLNLSEKDIETLRVGLSAYVKVSVR